MDKSKKNNSNKKIDVVQEPIAVYDKKNEEKLDPTNTDEQEIVLQKLLAIGLKQSEMGLGRSHVEFWAEMKLKHNFK